MNKSIKKGSKMNVDPEWLITEPDSEPAPSKSYRIRIQYRNRHWNKEKTKRDDFMFT